MSTGAPPPHLCHRARPVGRGTRHGRGRRAAAAPLAELAAPAPRSAAPRRGWTAPRPRATSGNQERIFGQSQNIGSEIRSNLAHQRPPIGPAADAPRHAPGHGRSEGPPPPGGGPTWLRARRGGSRRALGGGTAAARARYGHHRLGRCRRRRRRRRRHPSTGASDRLPLTTQTRGREPRDSRRLPAFRYCTAWPRPHIPL